MKSLMIRLLCCLLIFSSAQTRAQNDATLEQFTVTEVNGKVLLYWVITAGSSCNGIGIERSEDSLFFSEIGDIPGVCGNISSSTAYDFTDHNPITNRQAYYRLRLGNAGYSSVTSVEVISINKSGFQVRPNPARGRVVVYFENKRSEVKNLTLYSATGQSVLNINTSDAFFELNASLLPSGYYLFRISGAESSVTGTIIVTD